MWEIKHINAQNIVSFEDLNLDINNNVATAIIGENKDDQSQKVNGSGKSALIECIAIGITGDPLRKVKTDEFISDWAEEASIELLFHNTFNNKDFMICRNFGRKSPQSIECHIYNSESGEEIETDKTVQASVNDYNKFILSELGISRDDLYNYYILSGDYKSFFEATDRQKKELINRFSNGESVDQSIEVLEQDLEPLEKAVVEANNKVFSINGSIESLTNEINSAAQKQEEAKKSKQEKIAQYNQYIADKRAAIRTCTDQIDKAKNRIAHLKEFLQHIQEMNDAEESKSLLDVYYDIYDEFECHKLTGLPDVPSLSKKYLASLKILKGELEEYEKKINSVKTTCDAAKKDLDNSKDKLDKTQKEYDKLCNKLSKDENKLNKQLDEYDKKFDEIDKQLKEKKDTKNAILKEIASLETILAGKIVCPKCGHEFSLQSKEPLDKVQEKVDDKKQECSGIDADISTIKKNESKMNVEYNSIQDDLDSVVKQRNDFKEVLQKCTDDKNEKNNYLNDVNGKLAKLEVDATKLVADISKNEANVNNLRSDLFNDAIRIISTSISNGETYINNQNESISTMEGSIEAYQSSITALEEASDSNIEESLRNSRAEYEKKKDVALEEQKVAVANRDKLLEQKQLFLNYKAHLANTKLTAISQIVNSVLEEIGSNIRVDLQGYKVLKSGKLKESITVQLLKSGVECGSFFKFSKGERCRVNLASIIALQRLTNANCDDGKGLGLLVFDEILDSSDQVGFMSYCNTINKLQITSLLITQNSLPENYPYSLTVVKENGMSHILNN